ncbi:MAG: nucleoside 2-deoxyribosyltransferase [Burkholderiales bacterium]|nr:nucleoside 2-deoxyribosyltransferase [Burkholderiales bacterium]
MADSSALLVVGEVFVDLVIPGPHIESKMRLGGIMHAARGLWARGVDYALAAICPRYLLEDARAYAAAHGCKEFVWLGEVNGAPNVVVIGDAREVSWQGYEDLLRDRRHVTLRDEVAELAGYTNVLVFPGRFELTDLRSMLSPNATFDFDIAYDVTALSALSAYRGCLRTIIISTSSPLFAREAAQDIAPFLAQVREIGAEWLLLKENRGGSRLFHVADGAVDRIPAQLGTTVNSVGVGDAYSAVLSGLSATHDVVEAAWRGAQVATRYAQTTYPDDLRRDVQRDALVSVATLRGLWGTSLPWHDRPNHSIYLAAPDFSYISKPEIERAISSLEYHNFRLRRPLQEVGELPQDAPFVDRQAAYARDLALLRECTVVLAIPLGRDPGTLVEVGMALEMSKPVVTFDPRAENNNTMVVAGSATYSTDLDQCLNGLFQALGQPASQQL